MTYTRSFFHFLFLLLLAVNLLPVLGVEYFFTGDGPAHLYNSNLILQLLSSETSPANDFFHLRNELIPNLGGHILLSFFNWFLPARIAEQMVFSLGLALPAWGFRYLLRSYRREARLGQFLIFPLLHNFCFYIGFQSFVLSLGFMLFSIGYFVRVRKNISVPQTIWLALLIFTAALFHLFAGAIAGLFIGISFLRKVIPERKWKWRALMAVVPAFIFCGWYLLANSGESAMKWSDPWQTFLDVLRARPITTLSANEATLSTIYAMLLAILFALSFFRKLRRENILANFDLATLCILLLLFCFILPDEAASGGFITMRMLLCFFIFLSAWIGIRLKAQKITTAFVLAIALLNLWQVQYHYAEAKKLSTDATKLMEAESYIEEGSTLLPLNYSYHWLHYNIGTYLGSEKNIIVLDNYEADKTHFPVAWNDGMAPGDRLGDFAYTQRPTLAIEEYEQETGKRVDYVLLWEHRNSFDDEATKKTMALLAEKFQIAFASDDERVKLFERKPK